MPSLIGLLNQCQHYLALFSIRWSTLKNKDQDSHSKSTQPSNKVLLGCIEALENLCLATLPSPSTSPSSLTKTVSTKNTPSPSSIDDPLVQATTPYVHHHPLAAYIFEKSILLLLSVYNGYGDARSIIGQGDHSKSDDPDLEERHYQSPSNSNSQDHVQTPFEEIMKCEKLLENASLSALSKICQYDSIFASLLCHSIIDPHLDSSPPPLDSPSPRLRCNNLNDCNVIEMCHNRELEVTEVQWRALARIFRFQILSQSDELYILNFAARCSGAASYLKLNMNNISSSPVSLLSFWSRIAPLDELFAKKLALQLKLAIIHQLQLGSWEDELYCLWHSRSAKSLARLLISTRSTYLSGTCHQKFVYKLLRRLFQVASKRGRDQEPSTFHSTVITYGRCSFVVDIIKASKWLLLSNITKWWEYIWLEFYKPILEGIQWSCHAKHQVLTTLSFIFAHYPDQQSSFFTQVQNIIYQLSMDRHSSKKWMLKNGGATGLVRMMQTRFGWTNCSSLFQPKPSIKTLVDPVKYYPPDSNVEKGVDIGHVINSQGQPKSPVDTSEHGNMDNLINHLQKQHYFPSLSLIFIQNHSMIFNTLAVSFMGNSTISPIHAFPFNNESLHYFTYQHHRKPYSARKLTNNHGQLLLDPYTALDTNEEESNLAQLVEIPRPLPQDKKMKIHTGEEFSKDGSDLDLVQDATFWWKKMKTLDSFETKIIKAFSPIQCSLDQMESMFGKHVILREWMQKFLDRPSLYQCKIFLYVAKQNFQTKFKQHDQILDMNKIDAIQNKKQLGQFIGSGENHSLHQFSKPSLSIPLHLFSSSTNEGHIVKDQLSILDQGSAIHTIQLELDVLQCMDTLGHSPFMPTSAGLESIQLGGLPPISKVSRNTKRKRTIHQREASSKVTRDANHSQPTSLVTGLNLTNSSHDGVQESLNHVPFLESSLDLPSTTTQVKIDFNMDLALKNNKKQSKIRPIDLLDHQEQGLSINQPSLDPVDLGRINSVHGIQNLATPVNALALCKLEGTKSDQVIGLRHVAECHSHNNQNPESPMLSAFCLHDQTPIPPLVQNSHPQIDSLENVEAIATGPMQDQAGSTHSTKKLTSLPAALPFSHLDHNINKSKSNDFVSFPFHGLHQPSQDKIDQDKKQHLSNDNIHNSKNLSVVQACSNHHMDTPSHPRDSIIEFKMHLMDYTSTNTMLSDLNPSSIISGITMASTIDFVQDTETLPVNYLPSGPGQVEKAASSCKSGSTNTCLQSKKEIDKQISANDRKKTKRSRSKSHNSVQNRGKKKNQHPDQSKDKQDSHNLNLPLTCDATNGPSKIKNQPQRIKHRESKPQVKSSPNVTRKDPPPNSAKRKPLCSPKSVCVFWKQRKCAKGDACCFLHEGEQIHFDEICKFHRIGSCSKGSSCPFSHNLKSEPCNNLLTSTHCKFGDSCNYSHDSNVLQKAKREREEKEEVALEKLEQERVIEERTLPFAQFLIPIETNSTNVNLLNGNHHMMNQEQKIKEKGQDGNEWAHSNKSSPKPIHEHEVLSSGSRFPNSSPSSKIKTPLPLPTIASVAVEMEQYEQNQVKHIPLWSSKTTPRQTQPLQPFSLPFLDRPPHSSKPRITVPSLPTLPAPLVTEPYQYNTSSSTVQLGHYFLPKPQS